MLRRVLEALLLITLTHLGYAAEQLVVHLPLMLGGQLGPSYTPSQRVQHLQKV